MACLKAEITIKTTHKYEYKVLFDPSKTVKWDSTSKT
jgi:hypothetical protein